MNIAELFVRLRADNSDLDRKLIASERQMARLHGSTQRLEGGFRSTQLQTGRLGNQFASLAGQIAGVHPIVGNLASVMGNFAIGGLLTVGVLAGVAAIALAYDELTGSARKAKKETDAFIKSLVDEAKAAFDASYAGRQLAADRAYLALQEAKNRNPAGVRSIIGTILTGSPMVAAKDAAAAVKAVADAETAVVQANLRMGKTWEDLNPPLKNVKSGVDALKFSYNQLRDAIAKTRAEAERSGEEFWRNLASSMFDSEELTKSLMPQMGIGPVDISDSARSAGAAAQDITDNAERNARNVQDAIWGAASQSAGLIVNALNIGGGGKGSSLGGALGGTAGFAAGFIFGGGPVGGAIGATVGNILGSAIGGLFDSHKKEVNRNTQALRELTAAIYNSPSGYKVERGRYDATDVKEMGRAALKYSTRGGAPVLAGAR